MDAVGAFVGKFRNLVACVIDDVHVVARATNHQVGADAADQRVVTRAAIESVVAGTAIERVGASAADERVPVAVASKTVIAGTAE